MTGESQYRDSTAAELHEIRRALRADMPDEALAHIGKISDRAGDDPEVHLLRAAALVKLKRRSDAADALASVLLTGRATSEQLIRLAGIANTLRRPDLERTALAHAAEAGHPSEPLQSRLVALHLASGDAAAASILAEKLAREAPDNEEKFLSWISCLSSAGRYGEALRRLRKKMQGKIESDAMLLAWGHTFIDGLRRPDEVLPELPEAARGRTGDWVTHFLRGQALAALDRIEDALVDLREAAHLASDRACVWLELGMLQRRIGLTSESQESFRKVLERDADDVATLRLMGYDHNYQKGDFNFNLATRAVAHVDEFSSPAQVDIHYAAAKAFEDISDFQTAFAHYCRAGQIHKGLVPWSDEGLLRTAAALKNCLTPPAYEALRRQGFASDVPVFVIGMPRSGTTLIEQILASHPDVYGAGELKLAEGALNGLPIGRTTFVTTNAADAAVVALDSLISLSDRGRKYVEGLMAKAPPATRRIVDKMPGNYLWAGLISAMLPASRIIHCRRHPIDCCLSQFKLHFGAEVPYSYDLRDLGEAYRAYHEVMQLWSELLPPEQFMHVRYEDVVGNIETNARRLIEFLDLPWNDACLNYWSNVRTVRTASATQVRRPAYTRSIGQWRRYEKFLPPLLDEIGELAEAYERELKAAASQ